MSTVSPEPFTRFFTGSFDPMIALLWGMYSNFREIQVFYRQTNNTEVIDRLARMINGIDPGSEDYRPTLAVIVTWQFDAPLFSGIAVSPI